MINPATGLSAVPSSIYNALAPYVSTPANFLNALQSLLVPNQPGKQGKGGVFDAAYIFDYAGDTRLELSSEITDHYSSINTPIQDHQAMKPARIVLRGIVAELKINRTAFSITSALSSLQAGLATVPAYLGKYTPQALQTVQSAVSQAQNVTAQLNQYAGQAKNVLGLFSAKAPTNQQTQIANLRAAMLTQQLFAVITPWGSFSSMIIETIAIIQPETTRSWSEVSLTLKEMRFADAAISNSQNSAGRAAQQSATPTNLGSVSGPNQSSSILYNGIQYAKNWFASP